MLKRLNSICGLILCVVASSSFASNYFVGGNVHYVQTNFKPNYYFVAGNTLSFEDHAYGQGVGIFGGYIWNFNNSFATRLQANLDVDNARWNFYSAANLDTIEYRVPYHFGVTILPQVSVAKDWAIYLALGLQSGRVKESKRSGLADSYNYDGYRLGLNYGIGALYALTPQLDLFLDYETINYSSFAIDSTFTNGVVRARFKDAPRTYTYSLGVAYNFA